MDERCPPVPDQKTLVLVNTFIVRTVQLLNAFSRTCEDKLADVSRRAQHIEVRLRLLEAQLQSMDGGRTPLPQPSSPAPPSPSSATAAPLLHSKAEMSSSPYSDTEREASAQRSLQDPTTPAKSESSSSSASTLSLGVLRGEKSAPLSEGNVEPAGRAVETNPSNKLDPKGDPKLARFFRMLHVGVPEQAVKIRMTQEGFDPSLLDGAT